MHKLEIKLKQHTPLIHFQHDQEGGTLRASEVKPKLDRFLLKWLSDHASDDENKSVQAEAIKENKEFEKMDAYEKGKSIAKRKGWLKGKGEHPALDYRMKFIISETPAIFNNNEVQKDRQGNAQTAIRKDGRTIKKLKPYPLFFANLNADIDDPSEYKCFSMLNKPFKMELFSLNNDLIKYIGEDNKNLWPLFFQYTNFGTRQSKGFGSFYIDEDDVLFSDIEELRYRFSVDIRSDNKKWIDLFDSIDLFYKSLRSGINICWGDKFYMKPAIFQYAKSKGYDWDKKLIKQYFFDGGKPDNSSKFLFKDLLGLSSEENWMSYSTSISKVFSEKDNSNESVIRRFQSPIIIKPVLREGYFDVFIDSYPDSNKTLKNSFCNKIFHIESKKHKEKKLPLKTFPDFDIDDFLEFALLKNDIKNLTSDIYHECFYKLTSIYNEIKREHE